MCGISGIISLNNNANIKRDHLDKMADSMIHRGPDDRGVYLSPNNYSMSTHNSKLFQCHGFYWQKVRRKDYYYSFEY